MERELPKAPQDHNPIIRHQEAKLYKLELAKKFRKNCTKAEYQAWELLRHKKCFGLKFRRQQVLLGYIADFYCAEYRLVVELDGSVHEFQREYDEYRDRVIGNLGVIILRIKNNEINELYDRIYDFLWVKYANTL